MTFQKKTAEYAELMKDRIIANDMISDELYTKYGVNRGLRDLNGKGVLTGLTNISKIISTKSLTAPVIILRKPLNLRPWMPLCRRPL